MERRKFEESFQEAFKDAEVNPSEAVWTNIELDLEKAAGDQMKRRLLFFKTLAAASIIFALCVAGIGYYMFWETGTNGNLAQRNGTSEGQQVSPDQKDEAGESVSGEDESLAAVGPVTDYTNDDSPKSNTDRVADDSLGNKTQKSGTTLSQKIDSNTNPPDVASEQEKSQKAFVITNTSQNNSDITQHSKEVPLMQKEKAAAEGHNENGRELPLFYEPILPELQLPGSVADPGMLLLARLAEEEKRYSSEQKSKGKNTNEKLWTSVGFAAGGFNANNPSVSAPPSNSMYLTNTAKAATKQSQASGVAYSIGVSVGTRLSDRWVLQGGVNYLTQSSDYTANSVVVLGNNFEAPKAESLNAFASQTLDVSAQPKVAQTFPYTVNNDVRFVSVPLQAGYLVVNRKFGLQLNAGVSTDLFLQNTITPDGGGVAKTTQGQGEDSPYRSLNFSGLMGTELSYRLGYRYRVSLNPGLRYPFNSVYKSNTGVDSTPLTFDVGLRFRYIFH